VSEDGKESSATTAGDREVTSRRTSKSDGASQEEEKRPVPNRVRHVPSHVRSQEIDELDYKKSKVFIRYVSSRRKISDVDKPGEREEKKSGVGQSSFVHSRHKDAGAQEYDEERETEQEGRSVISGLHYVVSGDERHKGPQFDEVEPVHVGGEVLGSFRYVAAHNTPKKLAAAENLFSSNSQALIRLARNYEIRHDVPHDTKSQDCVEEGESPEKQLQASKPRRKVRFVSPVLSGTSSPRRKTFRNNDRSCPPSPNPHSSEAKDKHAEEDPETQKWTQAFRGDRIDPPTSDPRKGKLPAREPEKEQNDQEGKDEWVLSMPGNLLSTRRNASHQAEGREQFRSHSRSRGRSGYDAYHAYHTKTPTPPPIPSQPLSPLNRLHSPCPINVWHQNPNSGETKTFSERSVVGQGEKGIWWKDFASDGTYSNWEAGPKSCIDGADEQGWCERGIW
jgi:ribosomal protein S18